MSGLALTGGTPIRTHSPQWPKPQEEDVEAVSDVIRSGRWYRISESRAGQSKAGEFEKAFAQYQGARHGLAVSSGTAALEISLRALGIGPGDEVILPAHSFMATATAILMVGAVPIFVDIDSRTYNIDPDQIEPAITEHTRAIVPVHFGGLACDMDRILKIAKNHDLVVLEDASHSHGGKWCERGLGTIGDMAAFSIGDGKNLTVGEGGVILTDDEELWTKAVYLHDLWGGGIGQPGKDIPVNGFPVLAWNYRFTEYQAALALSQLARLEHQAETRAQNGDYINQRLEEIEGVRPMRVDPFVTRNAYHIFMFQYTGEGFHGLTRDQFLEALNAEGVSASGGYDRTLYQHPLFTAPETGLNKGYPLAHRFSGRSIDYAGVHCPQAERLCREETIWLFHPILLESREDVDKVVEAIVKVKDHADEASNHFRRQ